jgi:hypothetical protein
MSIPMLGYVDLPQLLLGLVAIFVVLPLLGSIFGRRSNVISGLVLTHYVFNLTDPTSLVTVEGRRTGLLAWLLSLAGLNRKYSIIITARFLTIVSDSPHDHDEFNVPISMVAVSYWGLARPTFWLIVGIGLIIAAIPAFVTIIGGILLLALGVIVIFFKYWRGQTIEVRVSPGDGLYYGFNFYRRAEGTMEKAAKTAALINKLTYTVAKVKGQE